MRYYTRVGADNQSKTREQIEELKSDKAIVKATTGHYYNKAYRNYVGKGEDVKKCKAYLSTEHEFPWIGCSKNSNDCLVHAVNFALRLPWFTCREQFVELMRKRCHETYETMVKDKSYYGVPIAAMQKFFLFHNCAYSLKLLKTIVRGDSHIKHLREFLQKNLGPNMVQYKEFVIVGQAEGVAAPYSHAYAVLYKEGMDRHRLFSQENGQG